MAEEKLILLDRKILSLDLSALCEFAPHAKVEKSAIEGKGKLSVIRAIRHKIEDSFEKLTGDDQMEYVEELIAHLGPPPLEGMEHEYGQEESETKGDLKQLQKELGDLESKQKLVEEKLAEIKKEKPADLVKGEGTINFPVKGVEQSIFRRDFKILGVVGELGQKDNLGYQALISQIKAGLGKGYLDKEVVGAVVHALQPGLQLRSYLENMTEVTLPRLRKILRLHVHEKNATELYQLLTNITQQPNEDPQTSFLIRALTIRQKVISASKESGSGIKYDASSGQSLFFHVMEIGLADETIRAKVGPLTQNHQVADEDLIKVMSLAISAETERRNKFSLASKGKSAKVYTVEIPADTSTKKEQQKDQHIVVTLRAVQADLASVLSEAETLRETVISQKADSIRPARLGNGVTLGARSPDCQECRRKKEGDRCPHCYLCGGPNHIARYFQAKNRSHPGNAPRLPPRDRE